MIFVSSSTGVLVFERYGIFIVSITLGSCRGYNFASASVGRLVILRLLGYQMFSDVCFEILRFFLNDVFSLFVTFLCTAIAFVNNNCLI